MTRPRYNLSAGPAMLPPVVVQATRQALADLEGSGLGLMEHSHRGAVFMRVRDRTEARLRTLLAIPDTYAVLFPTAGASAHFVWVPRNFLPPGRLAAYCHTGVWSGKAIAEAQRIGQVQLACDGTTSEFRTIPQALTLPEAPAYVHYTSNNTIYGTQWSHLPSVGETPLICDASSDICSQPLDVNRFALLYAGAQKNLGPAGISLVIARRSFLATGAQGLSPMEDYRRYDAEQSMYNTPNTLGIFVLGEVAQWLLDGGGLAAMAETNRAKAALLYEYLDASSLWRPWATPDSRSRMNVTFRAGTAALDAQALAFAEAHGFVGLAGHRLTGGLRASIYNAFPLDGVRALIDCLHAFESGLPRSALG